MVSNPTVIRLVVQISSGFDWLSNPWYEAGKEVAVWTGDYELRKLTVSWARTPTAGVVQDADMCTFHFLNLTGGNPDATWIDSDFTAVESRFDTFWDAIKTSYAPEIRLSQYMWRADGPAFKPHGSALSPTLRVVPKSVPGTSATTGSLPPQIACSVTEVTEAHYTAYGVGVPGHAPGTGRTQVRNRWGRFYLPAMTPPNLNDGRWGGGILGVIADAVKTMYDGCVGAGLIPVMYSPTTGNTWSVVSVHVDDIVDVVRSRRYVTPLTRTPRAIAAP